MSIVRIRMLMVFYRELAQLVSSGVSITEALEILSKQQGVRRLQYIVSMMKQCLADGSSLGESFERCADFFPDWHVKLVAASEKAGRLAPALASLATCMEKDYATQQQIMVGLAYPVLLLHAAIFLLPVVNFVRCGLSGYIAGVLSMLLPVYGIVFLIYLLNRMQRNERFKTGFDAFLVSIPRIGGLIRRISLARFIRALQTLSASGVSIVNSWGMAADASGNKAVTIRLRGARPSLQEGKSLSQAFMHTGLFDSSMLGMIAAAEKSGSITHMLDTAATYAERDNEAAIAVFTHIMPFVVYFLVAAFIGFRVISFYLGYYSQIFSVGG